MTDDCVFDASTSTFRRQCKFGKSCAAVVGCYTAKPSRCQSRAITILTSIIGGCGDGSISGGGGSREFGNPFFHWMLLKGDTDANTLAKYTNSQAKRAGSTWAIPIDRVDGEKHDDEKRDLHSA